MDMQRIARMAMEQLATEGAPMLLRCCHQDNSTFAENGRYPEVWTEHAFYGLRRNPASRELPGVLLQSDDQLILADALSAPCPRPGDQVLTGGEPAGQWNDLRNHDMGSQTWRVESVFTVQPGKTPVLYKLLVRRA